MLTKQVLIRERAEDILDYFRSEGRDHEPLFHIVSGTSIGAINATLLVS